MACAQNLRIDEAKRLLETDSVSAEAVAAKVGVRKSRILPSAF
jgi:transcriptional regulator GlxA family with amidase domain